MTTASLTQDVPPLFDPTTPIELVSVESSKITHVSVYPTRAEITRLYRFSVRTGQNQVDIKGLPIGLEHESLRVEGRGAATIHDVTISELPKSSGADANLQLNQLLEEKKFVEEKLKRCHKGQNALETYLGSLNAQHTEADQLEKILDRYESAGDKLYSQAAELEKKLKLLNESIEKENKAVAGTSSNNKLRLKISVGIFAASEGEVEIVLIYAVNGATWDAFYDIRVDMEVKDKPISLLYKAAIKQDTGESWDDVVLSLETVAPTIGVELPTLPVWRLAPSSYGRKSRKGLGFGGGGSDGRMELSYPSSVSYYPREAAMLGGGYDPTIESSPVMAHRGLDVAPGGKVNATFLVPGTASLPSDGVAHNVTIAQLALKGEMSWVVLPKVDGKTHLKAKITNDSDYTLLNGKASIYVDGSFIARTSLSLVSPQESFNCPLGVDPSVRVTYHPQSKKVSKSGLMSKISNYIISQRVTVYNTKSSAIQGVKVVDQIPVSERQNVTVRLISPPLVLPEPAATEEEKEKRTVPPPIRVSDGVVAQWEGADEPDCAADALGMDGKFYWSCSVPSLGKVNLLLQWEVQAPSRIYIGGLD